jgi:hypothetical protein
MHNGSVCYRRCWTCAYVALLNRDDVRAHYNRRRLSTLRSLLSVFALEHPSIRVRFHPSHCSRYQIFPIKTTLIAQLFELLLVLFVNRTFLPVPLQMVKGNSIFRNGLSTHSWVLFLEPRHHTPTSSPTG